MQRSPFQYGTTVSSESFTNREAEFLKLRSNLTSGVNTMLISPRRWGKSSLVEKVTSDIRRKEKQTKVVLIDLFCVSNEHEFLETFAREVIKATSGKWQEWLKSGKEIFRQVIPKISVGLDPDTDFSISFDTHELQKYTEEILNLPELIAQKRGIKVIICLDEFQSLANFAGYESLEKKMRAVWQRQKHVTYCLYGSKRHMMSEIFNSPAKPFFRFGDIIFLPKIQREKWIKFIQKSFDGSGKKIAPELAGKIADQMKCHSWYVQQLAHYTWNLSNKEATESEFTNALNELLQANSPLYEREVELLSATQLNLLKAVAKGETQLTSAAVMNEYQLGTPNNVSKNKQTLLQEDMLMEYEGKLEFLDPAFETWFKKMYRIGS
ncbi:MAG: ATP-binding protein [Cytophagaceae bacterium]|jgi:hypothetical protein|nr:ATP-binding protein [Cytophagaceae bacterium]